MSSGNAYEQGAVVFNSAAPNPAAGISTASTAELIEHLLVKGVEQSQASGTGHLPFFTKPYKLYKVAIE